MNVEFNDIVELIKAIVWPLIVLFLVLLFREQLIPLVGELGKRATKLSIFEVSIEFVKVGSPPIPWSDPTMYQSSNLIGGYVTTTTIRELFQRIRGYLNWHYLVIDIENGNRWLTSRLFLFTVILRYMFDLKCVVFVETNDKYNKRFLGSADPDKVREALAKKYPWLDKALIHTWLGVQDVVLTGILPKDIAESIITGFIEDNRIQVNKGSMNDNEWIEWLASINKEEWEQLQNQDNPVWEHTNWLTLEHINQDLRDIFYDRDNSRFVNSPDISTANRNRAILRRTAPFIALINDKEEFKGLVDRQALFEQIAVRLADTSNDNSADI